MDIIPVLDLARGVAVRAQAGDRARYAPVESALMPSAVGDAVALLRAFRARLGATTCYIADLDAIQGGAVQRTMLRELAQLETGFAGSIMVDAGAHTPESTLEVMACGASQVVIGLETLRAFTHLAQIVRLMGEEQVIFSVDLRLGSPILHSALHYALGALPVALSLAAQAVEAGVSTLLVLDLAVLHRESRTMAVRQALAWTVVWIAVAMSSTDMVLVSSLSLAIKSATCVP